MKNLILIFALAFSVGCREKKSAGEKVSKPVDVEVTECFAYHANGDTVTMTMSRLGDMARGRLVYNLYQKDGNFGTFRGKFSGDTLYIDYNFESEGMMSDREEAFLFSGKQLTRLDGEIVMEGMKQKIKDRKLLTPGTLTLGRISCN